MGGGRLLKLGRICAWVGSELVSGARHCTWYMSLDFSRCCGKSGDSGL